jgi:competence protein ComEC
MRSGAQQTAELHCAFLAVGHGTCVVLELPRGRHMLYDAGSLGSPHRPVNVISAYLWHRGIHHLDAMIVSHADSDHFNAVPGLLERFSMGAVYVGPQMFHDRDEPSEALNAALERADVPIDILYRGTSISCPGNVRLRVLHPPRRGVPGNDNANSVVLEVQFAGHRILLTGDLEDVGLDTLLSQSSPDCDVALVPHHGSPHSDPARFAEWCHARWVVISGGHRDGAERVTKVFQQAGATVLHSAIHGAVQVTVSRSGVEVEAVGEAASGLQETVKKRQPL